MQNMTPSVEPITAAQIGKINDLIAAGLRKAGLSSAPVQVVIETQGGPLVDEVVAGIRTRVEAQSEMIVRHVRVDRTRTPQQMLAATGRKQYTDPTVVATIPKGEGEEVDVYFFPGRRDMSDKELEKAFETHSLKPADPYSQAAVNKADPAFADKHPNGTHWKDANGNWCFATFHRWYDVHLVDVSRDGDDWRDYWWFAGLRK